MRKILVACLAAVLVLSAPAVSLAWNATGHRAIAVIAYRQLDDEARERVVALLKRHPAANDLWAKHSNNGPDADLNLFMNAAIFPDDARGPGPFRKFHRSRAHFVNFRIMADQGNLVVDPLPGENVINSYTAHARKVEGGRGPAADRALSLSWIFHQLGDLHQPLHTVARFSRAFPEGDAGGNGVGFPNPRGEDNLHSYWDGLLGTDQDPAAVGRLADDLVREHPRAGFEEELELDDIGDWARESIETSLRTVYRDLDPNLRDFADRPVGYEADAVRVARRRATLAGYRLADRLNSLFPPE